MSPETWPYVVVGLIICLTHFQEGITGFGCSVLALPFVTLLIGLEQTVPILVVQAWVLAALIVAQSWRQISWREYGRIVLLAGIGLPVGMYGVSSLPEHQLRWVLAGFMVIIAVTGLRRELRPQAAGAGAGDAPARVSPWAQALLPVGGIIQGAFGSGGPLIVVYATQALTNKSVFRATLCMTWLTLNTVLIAGFLRAGRLDLPHLQLNAAYLPATLLGLWAGNRAHYRLDDHLFRVIVYSVLGLAGLVLVWSLLR